MTRQARAGGTAAFALVLLTACQPAIPVAVPVVVGNQRPTPLLTGAPPANGDQSGSVSLGNRKASGPPIVEYGTGQFVAADVDRGASATGSIAPGPDVTLDFAGVDVRDVARTVLGGLLHVSYVVDPAVQGSITLQTGQPISRARVLPILTNALQVSGIALAQRDGIYQLVPLANASRGVATGGGAAGAGAGYVTRSVTPQYVSATDLQRVLEPLLPPGATVQADAGRNVLIVSGTDASVADILRDVSTFDVDYLRGMSFALLPLKNAQSRDVVKEVTALLGNGRGGASGLVSVSSIDRLNAVLVTSMQPAYLTRVRAWVDRLDRGGRSGDQQLFVYRVQNGRAADLATVLRRAMGLGGAAGAVGATTPAVGGAGGRQPDFLNAGGSSAAFPSANNGLGRTPNSLLGGLPNTTPQDGSPLQTGPASGGQSPGVQPSGGQEAPAGADQSAIRITADDTNNALVISATADDYARIVAALRRLDITQLQVSIDATVAEVTLTNQLQYGLQYYIKAGDFRGLLSSPTSTAATTAAANASGGAGAISVFPGFSFIPGLNLALAGSSGSSVILQALSQLTHVQVLSSPTLLVLNNQSARIQVGDQVPISTQSAVGVLAAGAPQVNSIEYRDTGVILNITPRVNASGLVLLDISEEVSNANNTTTSNISSPTISQRRVTSSVAVSDGETIALGGLIQDSRSNGKDGIPILQDIPVLGVLFGTRSNALTRTELIVLITPHVLRNGNDAREITQELRQKVPLTVPALLMRGG